MLTVCSTGNYFSSYCGGADATGISNGASIAGGSGDKTETTSATAACAIGICGNGGGSGSISAASAYFWRATAFRSCAASGYIGSFGETVSATGTTASGDFARFCFAGG